MRKRKARSTPDEAPSPLPKLPDEIVVDHILVRLPVKSLLRFRSVCKAWRAIVSDPVFIRAHLQSSASRCDQDPAFLITPTIPFNCLDPGDACSIRFYQWQQGGASNGGKAAPRFMHAKDFAAGEFNRLHNFSHCDGLVLAPTDTKLYLFNPATRDAVTLPASKRNDPRYRGGKRVCHGAGLGRDPRTGEYKVVRPFFRDVHPGFLIDLDVHVMGMEVLTVGGDAVWRETRTHPPYPVVNWSWKVEAGLHVKGFMYWRIDGDHYDGRAERGLLRLSLADEEFDVAGLPESLHPKLDHLFKLDVLRGEELCLSRTVACTGDEWAVAIWTVEVDDDGRQGEWEQLYDIRCPYPCDPVALVAGGSRLLLRRGCVIYEHDLAGPEEADDELTTVCRLDRVRYQQGRRRRRAGRWKKKLVSTLNVVAPYTESLVRPRLREIMSPPPPPPPPPPDEKEARRLSPWPFSISIDDVISMYQRFHNIKDCLEHLQSLNRVT